MDPESGKAPAREPFGMFWEGVELSPSRGNKVLRRDKELPGVLRAASTALNLECLLGMDLCGHYYFLDVNNLH